MNQRQENKLTSMQAVDQVLSENAAIVGTIPNMIITAAKLHPKIAEIISKDAERKIIKAGKAEDKYEAFDALVDISLKVATALYLYGKDDNINDAVEVGRLTKSKILKTRDSEVEALLKGVHQKGMDYKAKIEPYGITLAMLDDMLAKINDFVLKLSIRESTGDQRVGMTSSLGTLFKEGEDILDSLDGFAEILRTEYQEFYRTYRAAREIWNLGETKYKKKEVPPPTPTP